MQSEKDRVLTDGRLVHAWLVKGFLFFQKMLISEMVSRTAWARAGPTRAHTGPHGPIWAQKGPVLTNHLLTYHVAAPEIWSCPTLSLAIKEEKKLSMAVQVLFE